MGNICTICSWKCKQDVKECPFFNEDKNIPVLGRVTREGFFHNLGEDIRPVSSDCFVIGTSRHPVRRGELHLNEEDNSLMHLRFPEHVHHRESIPDSEGRGYPITTFLGLDVLVDVSISENHIIIVTPQGERHSFGRNPSGMTLINLVDYGVEYIRRRTGSDPREPVEHVRMELAEGQRRVREAAIGNARRHIEEGSISIPQNISIEIRDAQEPLNTSHSDNDSEVQ